MFYFVIRFDERHDFVKSLILCVWACAHTHPRTPLECDDTEKWKRKKEAGAQRWRRRDNKRRCGSKCNDDSNARQRTHTHNIKQSIDVAALFRLIVVAAAAVHVQLFRLCDRWANRFDRNSNQDFRTTSLAYAPAIDSILFRFMHNFCCCCCCCMPPLQLLLPLYARRPNDDEEMGHWNDERILFI